MKLLSTLALSVALVSCGGGGGNNAPTDADNSVATADGNTGAPFNFGQADVSSQVAANQTRLLFASDPASDGTNSDQVTDIKEIWQAENGWILVSATTDFSTSILWRGQHGEMQAILTTGDTIPGFPDNIFYATTQEAIVKDNGKVIAYVEMGGVEEQELWAIIEISPEGVVVGRARTGDSFESAVVISGFASLIDAGPRTYLEVLDDLFSDPALAELTTSGPDAVVALGRTTGQPVFPRLIGDCIVEYDGNFSGNGLFANARGDLVFNAREVYNGNSGNLDNSECPETSVVIYRDGVFERLTSTDTLVPNPGESTPFVNLLDIADDGTVFLNAESFYQSTQQLVTSIWAIDDEQNKTLFALSNETLPPAFNERISFNPANLNLEKRMVSFDSTIDDHAVLLASNEQGDNRVISGASRPLPYDDLLNPGATQLGRVTGARSDQIPGSPTGGRFSEVQNVRITADESVWFEALAGDGAGNLFSGVWQAQADRDPEVRINFADSYTHLGNQITVTDIETYIVSNTGDLLVHGTAQTLSARGGPYEVVVYRRGVN